MSNYGILIMVIWKGERMVFADILKEINPEWSIIEKARRIYTKMAEVITYDDRFSFLKDKDLLKEIYYRKIDIDRDEDTTMVCNPANTTYMNLLHRCGIEAELIYKKSNIKRGIEVPDVSCIFHDENGLQIYTNIIGDLPNCKYGLRTQYFAVNRLSYENAAAYTEIGKEKLEEIDRKTGYVKIDYSDLVFKLITDEVKNTNHFKKFLESQGIDTKDMPRDEILKNKMQYITRLIQFRSKTAGSFERKQLYRKLFCGSVLDKLESEKFTAYEFTKPNKDKIDYISCIQVGLNGKNIYFIYSDDEEKYVQIDDEELKEKIKGYEETHNKQLKFGQDDEHDGR